MKFRPGQYPVGVAETVLVITVVLDKELKTEVPKKYEVSKVHTVQIDIVQ